MAGRSEKMQGIITKVDDSIMEEAQPPAEVYKKPLTIRIPVPTRCKMATRAIIPNPRLPTPIKTPSPLPEGKIQDKRGTSTSSPCHITTKPSRIPIRVGTLLPNPPTTTTTAILPPAKPLPRPPQIQEKAGKRKAELKPEEGDQRKRGTKDDGLP
ncbi:hypothetical protein HDU67_003204, partial [Dinochytrium kinnereticum]